MHMPSVCDKYMGLETTQKVQQEIRILTWRAWLALDSRVTLKWKRELNKMKRGHSCSRHFLFLCRSLASLEGIHHLEWEDQTGAPRTSPAETSSGRHGGKGILDSSYDSETGS